jgi:hypothetical protein
MRTKILIILTITLLGCNNRTVDSFEIQSQNYFEHYKKMELNVIIKERIDKDRLKEISQSIRNKYDTCKLIQIFYYTPDIKIGNGAYAVATIDSDIEIEILRASQEESKSMKKNNIENANVIGKWEDNSLYLERTVILYIINDTLKMRSIYKDQSFGDYLMSEIIDNGKRRFNRIDNSEEWYILELNENLSTYGVNGKYNEMNKLN